MDLQRNFLPIDLKNSDGVRSAVPTLKELAMQTILTHLDLLEELGEIPEAYKRVIYQSATAEQLANLVRFNPSDKIWTDDCWRRHCRERFGETNKTQKTWRDTYVWCHKRREADREKARQFAMKFSRQERDQRSQNSSKIVEGPKGAGIKKAYNSNLKNVPKYNVRSGQKVPNLMQKVLKQVQQSKR